MSETLFKEPLAVRSMEDLIFNATVGRISSADVILVDKFGENLDIDSTTADVWSAGGTKVYQTTAGAVQVLSSSVEDASPNGTGIKTIRVFGYDSNYDLIQEDVTLNGQTPVFLSNSYIDIYRAFGLTVGSGGVNAGDITIRKTTGPVTLALIGTGYGQTKMSHYIIPNGYTGFLIGYTLSLGGVQAAGGPRIGNIFLQKRDLGGPWRTLASHFFTSDTGAHYFEHKHPESFNAKTSIKAVCTAETTNTRVSCNLEIVCIKNTYMF